VITGYLFSSPAWHHEVPVTGAMGTAATRICAVAQHLMDIDFQFGGGYVRRMLLFYFQSEIAAAGGGVTHRGGWQRTPQTTGWRSVPGFRTRIANPGSVGRALSRTSCALNRTKGSHERRRAGPAHFGMVSVLAASAGRVPRLPSRVTQDGVAQGGEDRDELFGVREPECQKRGISGRGEMRPGWGGCRG
jgi:hypothetical protein